MYVYFFKQACLKKQNNPAGRRKRGLGIAMLSIHINNDMNINIHIAINMNIDMNIVINMNIEN